MNKAECELEIGKYQHLVGKIGVQKGSNSRMVIKSIECLINAERSDISTKETKVYDIYVYYQFENDINKSPVSNPLGVVLNTFNFS